MNIINVYQLVRGKPPGFVGVDFNFFSNTHKLHQNKYCGINNEVFRTNDLTNFKIHNTCVFTVLLLMYDYY